MRGAGLLLTSSLIDPRARNIAPARSLFAIAPAAAIAAVLVAVFFLEVV